mmetsp:Transcript_9448/g.28845  ORF Transcript_9448/g.28845 Transcript_9448/m.28845 type:complete len:137 (+) Transcript_9448:778-1188(+)
MRRQLRFAQCREPNLRRSSFKLSRSPRPLTNTLRIHAQAAAASGRAAAAQALETPTAAEKAAARVVAAPLTPTSTPACSNGATEKATRYYPGRKHKLGELLVLPMAAALSARPGRPTTHQHTANRGSHFTLYFPFS